MQRVGLPHLWFTVLCIRSQTPCCISPLFFCRHTYTVKFFLVDQNGVEYLAAVGAPLGLVHLQLLHCM